MKETPPDLFLPRPPKKKTTLVRDHEYFIPTKFYHNPTSSSGEEVENVKVYGRTDDDGQTMDSAL